MEEALNLEVEVKLALDHPGDLARLLAALPAPLEVAEQTNHYYTDTAGVLAAASVTVRLREERPRFEDVRVYATVKQRTRRTGAVFASEERECAVDPERWCEVRLGARSLWELEAAPLEWLRAAYPLAGELRPLGVLANTRHRVPWRSWLLEVDRTRFPDGSVDAEIEVETAEPALALEALGGLLDGLAIGWRPQAAGKYARFRARLGGAR